MPSYQVADLEIDLHKYCEECFFYNMMDFAVSAEYDNPRGFYVVVARLDNPDGWNIHLQTLAWNAESGHSLVIDVGTLDGDWIKRTYVPVEFDIRPSNRATPDFARMKYHDMNQEPVLFSHIDLDEFNSRFCAEIQELPTTMYALGMQEGRVFCFNANRPAYIEHYWWNGTNRPATHIFQVARRFFGGASFYFVMSDRDGGAFERTRWSPFRVADAQMEAGSADIALSQFPVFHKNKLILGASNHANQPRLIDVPDRHYFYHNLYHSFRSFHRAVPFGQKIPQLVYGGNPANSCPENFKHASHATGQRQYFLDCVAAENPRIRTGNTPRQDMVLYKYILDIDGNGATWDATAWKLNSGSVMFKPDAVYRQWFYDQMRPGVHYIQVRDDFGDIDEKIDWCESHQPECRWIASNARALFQHVYAYRNVIRHTKSMLEQHII